jgi:hypothetical protein
VPVHCCHLLVQIQTLYLYSFPCFRNCSVSTRILYFTQFWNGNELNFLLCIKHASLTEDISKVWDLVAAILTFVTGCTESTSITVTKRFSCLFTGLDRLLGLQRVEACRSNRTMKWQGCQPYALAAFTVRRHSWF